MIVNPDVVQQSEQRVKSGIIGQFIDDKEAREARDTQSGSPEAEFLSSSPEFLNSITAELDNVSSTGAEKPVVADQDTDRRGSTASLSAKSRIAERKSPPQIEKRLSHLRFGGVRPSDAEYERTLGTNDLVDEFYLERALVAAKPVCRLTVRTRTGRLAGYATGFMISPRLLLTNWHVFHNAEEAYNSLAEFNFRLDIRGDAEPSYSFALQPDQFFISSEELDYAVVAVSPRSQNGAVELPSFGYHLLVPDENKIEEGEWITIIQHPGGERRQFAIRENKLLEKQDLFLWYVSDTAQGSSGAPAFNDSFQVVALHHSGKARRDGAQYVLKNGMRVDSLRGIDDSLVDWEANEGLRVSRLCRHLAASLRTENALAQELLEIIQQTGNPGGDIMSSSIGGRESANATGKPSADSNTADAAWPQITPPAFGASTVQFHIAQVNIEQVNVAAPGAAGTKSLSVPIQDVTSNLPIGSDETEKLLQPIIDPDYSNRKGYDPDYLGVALPMPEAADLGLVSKMDDGEHHIPYEHFSVVVHKNRRLAIFTASNVDGRTKSRRPEQGDYSRKGLTGLSERDQEKWKTDPRIPEKHQLPDNFYNKDGQAFDKGHIVRRDDVCWGKTRAQIIRANGDTFHTTNCSPQIADFNRSNLGGIWGRLENEILKQAKSETYTLFAGPVLDAEDDWFEGRDDWGAVRIQIPQRFWKIVVANAAGTLQSFAFLLEQDLSQVPLEEEFQVTSEWNHSLIEIDQLEGMLDSVQFPNVIKQADQYSASAGDELVKVAEIKRL